VDEPSTYVGLDVHRQTIAVCVLKPWVQEPWRLQIAHQPARVRKLAERLKREAPGPVRCCYEAGPTGYALQRTLNHLGLECTVIAPSLTPVRPGDHVKTDHRDAKKLAELFRAGLLTAVRPPSEEEEAVRDLCRCRDDARVDLTRARHRLNQFLLRHGRAFGDGKERAWSQKHRRWLGSLRFERALEQAVFDDYLLNVEQREARRLALDHALEEIAARADYRERVGWLRCFRGIDTVSAITILAELHDLRRFPTPGPLMAYLGLVPSEASSGDRQRRGGITCAGNRHVRRLLIEAAWHYRHRARVGPRLARRRVGQPAAMVALADRAQRRLCRRFRRMEERNKHHTKIVVAVARELAGFLWAALTPSPAAG
jgi:transposase